MNKDQLNLALAILILVMSVPALVLARAAVRRKMARRSSDFAQAMGMRGLDPDGPEARPILEGGWRPGEGSTRMIVSVIGGTHSGREVLLAEVAERPGEPGSRPGWIGNLFPSGPKGSRHLMILFNEPIPGLPEFRIGLPSAEGLGASSPSVNGLVLVPQEARSTLPESFLDRAAQVLAGRPHPWVVEGTGHRLAIRIARWRLPARVQSYRAILDDAVSLRESFDEAPSASDMMSDPRSIRSALERIRQTSRSTREDEDEAGKPDW